MFLLQLGLIGLCVALVPLSYVLVRNDADKFRKLVWITCFLTLDLVMFGSFTRLTDSGLGCPDWPGCYGTASPLIAHAAISAAQAAAPSGPVTVSKAWIEMIHRYFAMAVGVLILAQLGIAWSRRREARGLWRWPAAILALICVQGAFGAWTVTLKLQPVIVSVHLLLGLVLLGALAWFGARLTPVPGPVDPRLYGWRWPALLGLGVLVAQIALGGWVSTNYAVLACTDFPLCNGQWVPPMDFATGFHLWRKLGMNGQGGAITQSALVAIHWTHRAFAGVVFIYLGWLAFSLRKAQALTRPANALLAMLVVQFLTGLSNIVLRWPLPIAVAHNGGAAIMLLIVVMLNYRIASARHYTP